MANFCSVLILIWLASNTSLVEGGESGSRTTSEGIQLSFGAIAPVRGRNIRGMLALAGGELKCFVGLNGDGTVSAPDWCRSAIPGLSLVKKWRWQASDLLLLNGQSQTVFALHKDVHTNIFRQMQADGTIVLFYPFDAEAVPH